MKRVPNKNLKFQVMSLNIAIFLALTVMVLCSAFVYLGQPSEDAYFMYPKIMLMFGSALFTALFVRFSVKRKLDGLS